MPKEELCYDPTGMIIATAIRKTVCELNVIFADARKNDLKVELAAEQIQLVGSYGEAPLLSVEIYKVVPDNKEQP